MSNLFRAVVVADCRLTYPQTGTHDVYRDVCQKLFSPTPWSLIGFAGDLCLARDLLLKTGRRLTQPISPGWLRNDDAIRDHVAFHHYEHLRVHRRARELRGEGESAQLLIVWMDLSKSVVAGGRPGDEGWQPGVEMITVGIPPLVVTRSRVGVKVIGSGSKIAASLEDQFLTIANAGTIHAGYIASVIINQLLEVDPVPSVGGLYQSAVLSSRGVQWIPYFSWVDVAPGFGTYVAMRIEHGSWVQEHRPTGTKVRIASPFEIAVEGAERHPPLVFDPQLFGCDTPGVISAKNPREVFHVYDPDDFAQGPLSEQIRESWGDEPIAPISFLGGS